MSAEDSGWEIEIDLSDLDGITADDFHAPATIIEEAPVERSARPATPLLDLWETMTQDERKGLSDEHKRALWDEQARIEAWDRESYGPGRTADGPEAPAPAAASDWQPQDLDAVLAQIEAGTLQTVVPEVGQVQVPDGEPARGLLYEGRVNGIAGESGGGKSWIALAIGVEQMQAGRTFVYVDHEDSLSTAALRLVTLGCPLDLVRSRFRYVHPDSFSEDGVRSLVRSIEAGTYVVVDSTGESLAAAGLKQNADEDVAGWFSQLPKPLAEAGATVLLLDHMVKSEDGGLWPIGSQRKRAAITGVQYIVKTIAGQAPSRTSDGMAQLVVAKDRHGAYEVGSTASVVRFTHPGTGASDTKSRTVTWTPDGTLRVTFGVGKTREQIEREKADREAKQLDADVRELGRLAPPPKSQNDVKTRLGWGSARALNALQAWRSSRS